MTGAVYCVRTPNVRIFTVAHTSQFPRIKPRPIPRRCGQRASRHLENTGGADGKKRAEARGFAQKILGGWAVTETCERIGQMEKYPLPLAEAGSVFQYLPGLATLTRRF